MQELNQKELEGLVTFNQAVIGIYFYTPLCGTCKVATQMLEIVALAIPDFPLYKCNMNLVADYALRWQLSSVPCLVILDKKELIKKLYAFQSVSHLYELLQGYQK